MSEQTQNTVIEDEIRACLDVETRETALSFIAYLNERQLTPKRWFGLGYWRIPYEDHYLCGIHLKKDGCRFWFWSGDYSGAYDDQFMQAVYDHVRPCIKCTADCKFGKDTVIFGKDFQNTCIQFPIQFETTGNNGLECVKQLLEHWKTAAPNEYSWHYRD